MQHNYFIKVFYIFKLVILVLIINLVIENQISLKNNIIKIIKNLKMVVIDLFLFLFNYLL